jgi:hypothetical protein
MSMLLYMSILHVLAVCLCCMPMVHIYGACPCCIPMLLALTAFTHCISTLHVPAVHAACAYCNNMLHAACSMSILHGLVAYTSTCQCCSCCIWTRTLLVHFAYLFLNILPLNYFLQPMMLKNARKGLL